MRATSYDPAEMQRKRIEAGYTCQEVADHLGVVKQAVSAWESGRNLPTQADYEKMITLFAQNNIVALSPKNFRGRPVGVAGRFHGKHIRLDNATSAVLPLLREVVMYLRCLRENAPEALAVVHRRSLEAAAARAMSGLTADERAELEAWL